MYLRYYNNREYLKWIEAGMEDEPSLRWFMNIVPYHRQTPIAKRHYNAPVNILEWYDWVFVLLFLLEESAPKKKSPLLFKLITRSNASLNQSRDNYSPVQFRQEESCWSSSNYTFYYEWSLWWDCDADADDGMVSSVVVCILLRDRRWRTLLNRYNR